MAENKESDDDEEIEEDEENMWDAHAEIPQGELEGDSEAGRRLALYKMEWDITTAADILAIF